MKTLNCYSALKQIEKVQTGELNPTLNSSIIMF